MTTLPCSRSLHDAARRPWRPLWAAALAAVVAWHPAGMPLSAESWISLKRDAVPASGLIRLGEVAEIRSTDPEEKQRLEELILSPAPPPGRSVRIDFHAVRRRIDASGLRVAYEFTGASQVLVHAAAGRPAPAARPAAVPDAETSKRLADMIRAELERRFPQAGPLQVALPRAALRGKLPAAGNGGALQIDCGDVLTSEMRVALRWDTPAGTETAELVCGVREAPRVLVARTDLRRGEIVTRADLVWHPGEVTAGCDDPEALCGQQLVRSLRAGEPVRPADVRPVWHVRSGDVVTVSARRGSVLVQMQTKCRANAALGETVELTTLDGKTRLLARVTGPREAEVEGAPSIASAPSGPQAGRTVRESSYAASRLPAEESAHGALLSVAEGEMLAAFEAEEPSVRHQAAANGGRSATTIRPATVRRETADAAATEEAGGSIRTDGAIEVVPGERTRSVRFAGGRPVPTRRVAHSLPPRSPHPSPALDAAGPRD